MKKILFLPVLIIICHCAGFSQNAFLSQELLDKLSDDQYEASIPVMVMLKSPIEVTDLKQLFEEEKVPVSQRPQRVVNLLMQSAAATQPQFLSFLSQSGQSYSDLQQLWIANIVSFTAGEELIHLVADHPLVERIDLNLPRYKLIEPEKSTGFAPKTEGGIEPGLAAINAPALWALGYTGHGRIAYSVDTGVWPDHPALEDHFLGNFMPLDETWFAYDSPVPVDKSSSHGTHTMGTILGVEAATSDTIGVAPRAYFIASDPVVSNLADVKPLTDFMFAYQWSLNPDGDLSTWNDIPDVINNSWGFTEDLGEAPCPAFVIPVFNAVEAAGIANVFSAGNEGPEPSTIGIPHNTNTGLVNSFTVAAVNGNTESFPVANFSSRGPSLCGGSGSLLIKPEVSAPGMDVRSSVANDEYALYSGTSMAAPHVCGAVLLLKEAFPYLSGEDILLALYYSASDLGDPGEDNTYGMGMIDVMAAYNYLSADHIPQAPQELQTDISIDEIVLPTVDAEVVCSNNGTLTAQIRVKNSGAEPISSFTVNYTSNDVDLQSVVVNQLIDAGTDILVDLPNVPVFPAGKTEFHVWIDTLVNEYDRFNNHAVRRWEQLHSGGILLPEDFLNGIDSSFWSVINPDLSMHWDTTSTIGADGNTGISACMLLGEYQVLASQRDFLITPLLDPLDQQMSSTLEFDYFYRRKNDIAFTNDTMAVYFNTNCEQPVEDGTPLFFAGGDDLYTVLESGSNSLPETAGDWKHISLELPAEAYEMPFTISFTTINRRGNNILLDNIQLGTAVGIADHNPQSITISPNPSAGIVRLIFARPLSENSKILISDVTGKKILEQNAGGARQTQVDITQWDAGVYIVQVFCNGKQMAEGKIVKQ